ncbi:MAG: protein-L-isoaspartate(D-aspartate) O-methyltransferase [Pirellulaceae bacterium]
MSMQRKSGWIGDRPSSRSLLRWLLLALLWGGAAMMVGPESLLYGQDDSEDRYRTARKRLLEDVLQPGGVREPKVLEAIGNTPRHEFVDASQRDKAYYDMALPIGESQTISSPYIVAVMTEALQTAPTDRVLEIGTGSGYQAAVLSPLVKEVYTIEIVESLGLKATQLLKRLGYTNVFTRVGDGFKGWEEVAPFDKIIVTCSPEKVPEPLVEQLAEGGLMVIPVGERYQQSLYLMRKRDGKLEKEALRPTLFVPMTGQADQLREVRPDPSNPQLVNGDFELPLDNPEHCPGWYYQFGMRVESDPDAPEGPQHIVFENDVPHRPTLLLQGMALDGTLVRKVRLSTWVSTTQTKTGGGPEEKAAIVLQFFDKDRNRIGYYFLGPFLGTKKWHREQREFEVPPNAKEAIVSIGMFGGTGIARFDGVKLEVVRNR